VHAHSEQQGVNSPLPSQRIGERAKASGGIRQYVAVAVVFAVLALVVALGTTGWVPTTGMEWLAVVGLVPAGVGGVLIGDRIGLWLKDHGVGRR
jgi:hypothetical protein